MWQIKALWSKFQCEVFEGLPPVICSSTAAVAAEIKQSDPPPPSRVHVELPEKSRGKQTAPTSSTTRFPEKTPSMRGESHKTPVLVATAAAVEKMRPSGEEVLSRGTFGLKVAVGIAPSADFNFRVTTSV